MLLLLLLLPLQEGMTSLHMAVVAGHKEVVAQLLAAGADVDARLEVGTLPVWIDEGCCMWH
jgi:ankyrin repeat protein